MQTLVCNFAGSRVARIRAENWRGCWWYALQGETIVWKALRNVSVLLGLIHRALSIYASRRRWQWSSKNGGFSKNFPSSYFINGNNKIRSHYARWRIARKVFLRAREFVRLGRKDFLLGGWSQNYHVTSKFQFWNSNCLRLFNDVVTVCKIFGEMEIRRYVA